MENINVEVNIDKDTAVLAGKKHWGTKVVPIDPAELSEEQRVELVKSSRGAARDGWPYLVHKPGFSTESSFDKIPEPTLENIKLILDERIQLRKKREDSLFEQAKKVREWFIDNKRTFDDFHRKMENLSSPSVCYPAYGILDSGKLGMSAKEAGTILSDHKMLESIKRIEDSCKDLNNQFVEEFNKKKAIMKEKQAEKELLLEEKKRLEAEKKSAKDIRIKQQIELWICEKCSESQKARWSENLLDINEVIDAIREETYAPLDVFQRYQKIRHSEVCKCEYERDCRLDCEVDDKKFATDEEYSQLTEMRKLMPNAVIVLREHTCKTDECEQELKRVGFSVSVTIGELDFHREYGMTEN